MPASSLQSLYGILTPLAAASDGLDGLYGPDSATAVVSTGDPSLVFSVVRMLGALGVVLALLIFTLWFFKRMGLRWSPALTGTKGGGIEVLHQRSLGGRRMLTVVRWEGRRILLGVANESITPLASELEAAPGTEAQEFPDELERVFSQPSPKGELLPWGPAGRESSKPGGGE